MMNGCLLLAIHLWIEEWEGESLYDEWMFAISNPFMDRGMGARIAMARQKIGVKLIWPEKRKIDNSIELNLFESRVGNSETFSSYFFNMVAFGFFFQLEVCRLSVGLL